jgi:thiol:disulfide interchange protein DsbD
MALVYTLFGIAAGLAGEGLAGALQKPWMLLLFASLLLAISLSLFDVYQLQMPSALQGRLNQLSNRLQGGRTLSVFVMGGFSALIVGPCVAGPLAGALIYISQTHDVVLGGVALFSMAMGMSVPLLLIGLSAGRLLPRAGAWMVAVKHTFGLMLMAVALWMIQPILPAPAALALWGAFAIVCAVFLRVFDGASDQVSVARRFSRSLGILVFIVGIFELAGAAVGGVDVLLPLEGFKALATGNATPEKVVPFRRVTSLSQLDQVLATTQSPVMLDFYADWCVSCKEMERFTFSNPAVASHLRGITLVQVDVTANTADDRALMKKFSLFGPPGILFFDAAGREVPNSRVIGYEQPDKFLEHLTHYLAL